MVDIVQVYYSGSSPENNVKRIGDKSLSFPDEVKGKRCVFVSDDVHGDWWWQLMYWYEKKIMMECIAIIVHIRPPLIIKKKKLKLPTGIILHIKRLI